MISPISVVTGLFPSSSVPRVRGRRREPHLQGPLVSTPAAALQAPSANPREGRASCGPHGLGFPLLPCPALSLRWLFLLFSLPLVGPQGSCSGELPFLWGCTWSSLPRWLLSCLCQNNSPSTSHGSTPRGAPWGAGAIPWIGGGQCDRCPVKALVSLSPPPRGAARPRHVPVYSGKQMVRGDFLIFSANRSFLLRKRMMEVSMKNLLLQMESKSMRDSCMRFCSREHAGRRERRERQRERKS